MTYQQKIAQKMAEAERFHNIEGEPQVEKLNPRNKTLSITVFNSTTVEATARLFGAIGNATAVNNLAAGILVTPSNATHAELIDTIRSDPFRVRGLKYITKNNVSQLSNAWLIVDEDAFGHKKEDTYIPISHASTKDFNSKFIEDHEFAMSVRKTTYVTFALEGSEEVTIILNISEKLERAAELSGRATLKKEDPYRRL